VAVDGDGHLSSGERLLFDHEQVLADAVNHLRERYERRPDPDHLLGERFTLNELRRVHEAVLGEPLLRDTFNRRMLDHLQEVSRGGESLTRSSGGRPARIYRRRVRRDLSPSEVRRTRLPRGD
jgi:8-oxo-dGTP diphosphatase